LNPSISIGWIARSSSFPERTARFDELGARMLFFRISESVGSVRASMPWLR
jgi:hypothetical protein